MDIMYSNILVDSTTHKIAHPSRLDYLKIDIKQTLSPKQKLNKLKIPEDMESWGVRQIRFSDLDFNGHMSNSIYGNIIEDYLPYNYINNSNICRKELYKIQINYVKESKLKDDMLISGKELEQGFIMVGSVEGCRTFECQGQFRF